MRRRAAAVCIAISAMCLPAALLAQNLENICSQVANVDVGEWVEYEVTGEPQVSSMYYAAIGAEDVDGEEHRWFELKMTGSQTMIMQMLVPGTRFDPTGVVEMRVQAPGQPVMTMTGQMLEMARQNMDTDDIYAECVESELVGDETVTVPAGSVDATRLKSSDGADVWVSLDVPFGLVKSVTSDGMTLALKEHGTGATSSLQN